jgi:hypothetical protein
MFQLSKLQFHIPKNQHLMSRSQHLSLEQVLLSANHQDLVEFLRVLGLARVHKFLQE